MRKADNLPPSCAVVTKSGSLNFLEPTGPVQACNGIAFLELELKNPKSVLCNFIVLIDCNDYLVYPRVYGVTTARSFRFNSP